MIIDNQVLVTGANGYLASHICRELLSRGYKVHACVRNKDNPSSVEHLRLLDPTGSSLKLFSTGDMADDTLAGRYDEPLKDVDAVFHAATPLSPKLNGTAFDGLRDMLNPGMKGTREILNSIAKSEKVKTLILTSSMSAAAPVPEPAIKDESHWSDDAAQLQRNNFYGCLKTRQEKMCRDWAQEGIEAGTLPKDFKYAAICPTMIIGPPVGAGREGFTYIPSGTMGALHRWMTGGRRTAPNDSMSFVHVKNCAAQHVSAMESDGASGRYFSLVESWHWNDIMICLKEIYPGIDLDSKFFYEGADIVAPTKFNLQKMDTLGVKLLGIKEILQDSVKFFTDVGVLI